MKKQLALAAVLLAFALAQTPALAGTPATTTAVYKATKKDKLECKQQANAEKDGKKPTSMEAKAAYTACLKAKKSDALKKSATDAAKSAPTTEKK